MKCQTSFLEIPLTPLPVNPFADARPIARCDVCRSEKFVDRRIHGGASTIRECARCRRFMGFPLWYGQEVAL